MNTSKAKGTAAESAVVAFLHDTGWPYAERRALAGAADKGDILGIPGTVIEVKSVARVDLATIADELEREIANARADTGAAFIRRRGRPSPGDWYAVMSGVRWAALMHEAGR